MTIRAAVQQLRRGWPLRVNRSTLFSMSDEEARYWIFASGSDVYGNTGFETVEPLVTVELLRFYLDDCLEVECARWQISNTTHGLIWMDERGKLKGLPKTAVIRESTSSGYVLDWFHGPLMFTGPELDNGEVRWMTHSEQKELNELLKTGGPVRIQHAAFLQIVGKESNKARTVRRNA